MRSFFVQGLGAGRGGCSRAQSMRAAWDRGLAGSPCVCKRCPAGPVGSRGVSFPAWQAPCPSVLLLNVCAGGAGLIPRAACLGVGVGTAHVSPTPPPQQQGARCSRGPCS